MSDVRSFASTFQGDTRTWGNQTLVTVALEDGTPPYTLPRADLAGASTFFAAALARLGTISLGGEGNMPACDGKMFDLFLYWIYHEKLPDPLKYRDFGESAESNYTSMILLCSFADRYLIKRLQNAAMRYILMVGTENTDGISIAVTKLAFKLTGADSPLRRWAVRYWDYCISGRVGTDDSDRLRLNELNEIEDFGLEYGKVQYAQQCDPTLWVAHQAPSEQRDWGYFRVSREEAEREHGDEV